MKRMELTLMIRGVFSVTSDKQSLIKTFRQQLVNRAGTIDLYYHCNQKITQDFFDEFSAELFNGAVAHTGVGKEGDLYQMALPGMACQCKL